MATRKRISNQQNRHPLHDENGAFAKGNPGGPGRPRGSVFRDYSTRMKKAVSEEDLAEVIRTVLNQAKAGDIRACEIVLDRCLGKPTQALSVAERDEVYVQDRSYL